MTFKPGVSGNPSGRPKEVKDVIELARTHTTAAIERLVEWMQSDNPRASPVAAQALLDRGWGRPMQPITQTTDEKIQLHILADDDLATFLAMLRKVRASPAPQIEHEPDGGVDE